MGIEWRPPTPDSASTDLRRRGAAVAASWTVWCVWPLPGRNETGNSATPLFSDSFWTLDSFWVPESLENLSASINLLKAWYEILFRILQDSKFLKMILILPCWMALASHKVLLTITFRFWKVYSSFGILWGIEMNQVILPHCSFSVIFLVLNVSWFINRHRTIFFLNCWRFFRILEDSLDSIGCCNIFLKSLTIS